MQPKLRQQIKTLKERLIWRSSDFLIIIIIIFSFLTLNEPILDFFNKILVGKVFSVFSKESYGLFQITLYFVLFAYAALWLFQKIYLRKLQVSIIIIFLTGFFSVLYFHERYTDRHYDFFPIVIWKTHKIAQADPLFIISSLASVFCLLNFFRGLTYPINNTFFLQDLPIKILGDDKFNRSQFYTEVLDKLKHIAFDTEKGFAMALNSSWVYGKTSLLELIRADFKKEKSIVCMNYNPWLSSNKQSLTIDFFTVLENELGNYINTADILLEYGKKVSKYENDSNPLKSFADYFEKEKTIEQRFKEITELIRQTGRRFYVIIDDLDRLDNDEVFEVLRLIRNVANFPRLHYIVAYDRNYVINALTQKKIYDPKNYLEKIFELEIELPKIEEMKIREMLNQAISEALKRLPLQTQTNELLALQGQVSALIFNSASLSAAKIVNVNQTIPEIFKSKRDIIKFVNSFIFSFSLNKDLVYLPDLFALEIIKFSNIGLYEILSKNDKYLDIFQDSGTTTQYYKLFQTAALSPVDPQNTNRENLFSIIPKTNIGWQQKLIESLFTKPELSDINYANSIVFKNNLKSYFIFAVSSPQITNDQINQLLN